MDWIIKFTYLRDVSFLDDSNVFEIYAVADYFGMLGLMKACVEFIIKILSPKNCVGFWFMGR
jgi:hypothetical protein